MKQVTNAVRYFVLKNVAENLVTMFPPHEEASNFDIDSIKLSVDETGMPWIKVTRVTNKSEED